MKLLVSSCLLGENTRYDGNHNLIDSKLFGSIIKNNEIFSLCPELEGGLKTPRPAAEIKNQKVLTKDKKDLSLEFYLGALKTLDFCKKNEIKRMYNTGGFITQGNENRDIICCSN